MATIRDLSRGDVNDLHLQIQALNSQLNDRKQANVILSAENQRLLRALHDLQVRLGDIEAGRATKRGESSSLQALRAQTAEARQHKAIATRNLQEITDENDQLRGQLDQAQADMESLSAELEATRQHCTALEVELAQEKQLSAQLTEEKANAESEQVRLTGEHKEMMTARDHLVIERDALKRDLAAADKAKADAELAAAKAIADEQAKSEQAAASHQEEVEKLKSEAGKAGESVSSAKDVEIQAVKERVQKGLEATSNLDGVAFAATGGVGQNIRLIEDDLDPGSGATRALSSVLPSFSASGGKDRYPAGPLAGVASGNFLEISVHDLSPSQSGPLASTSSWPFVALDILPGPLPIPKRSWILGNILSRPDMVVSQVLAIDSQLRLHFKQSDIPKNPWTNGPLGKLGQMNGRIWVADAKACLLGGISLPGSGANEGDMSSVLDLLACAIPFPPDSNDVEGASKGDVRPQALCIELFASEHLPQEATLPVMPTRLVMTLSSDWTRVAPQELLAPGSPQALAPDEFVVDPSRLHPIQLNKAKFCGLFVAEGGRARAFRGTDGRVYQVWAVASEAARQQATLKHLNWKDLPLVKDDSFALGLASSIIAMSPPFPLLDALASPSLAQVAVNRGKAVLVGSTTDPWLSSAPSELTGSCSLKIHRPGATSNDIPVGTFSLTSRLQRDIVVDDKLLTCLVDKEGAVAEAAPASNANVGRKWPADLANNQATVVGLLATMSACVDEAVFGICRASQLKDAHTASVVSDESFRNCCNAIRDELNAAKTSTSYLGDEGQDKEAKMLLSSTISFVSKALSKLLSVLGIARWLNICAKDIWPDAHQNEDLKDKQSAQDMHADFLEELQKKFEASIKTAGLPVDPVPRQPAPISSLPSLSVSMSQQAGVKQGPDPIDDAPPVDDKLEALQRITTTKLSPNAGALERSLLPLAQELMIRILKAKAAAELAARAVPPSVAAASVHSATAPAEAREEPVVPVASTEQGTKSRLPRASEASTDSEDEERNIVNLAQLKQGLPGGGGPTGRPFDEESECGTVMSSSTTPGPTLPKFQRSR